jgi:hypothetical protein
MNGVRVLGLTFKIPDKLKALLNLQSLLPEWGQSTQFHTLD